MPQSSIAIYARFSTLGGRDVPLSEVQAQLNTLPLDLVLGCLSSIAQIAVQTGHDFYSPRCQGMYLNYALADNFPYTLPGASRRINMGSFPDVGNQRILAHPQNIAWLTHHAVLHCQQNTVTTELNRQMEYRVARLLLIANDFISQDQEPMLNSTLIERKQSALEYLRLWQFSESFDIDRNMRRIIRQRLLFLEYLPEYFDVQTSFQRVTNGVDINVYYAVFIFGIFDFFSRQLSLNSTRSNTLNFLPLWIQKSNHFSNLETNQNQANEILGWWSASLEQYPDLVEQISQKFPDANPSLNYMQLKITPFVEARSDDLFLPIPSFLFQKVVDEPYFKLTENLEDNERNAFTIAMGDAYEDYANELVAIIATKDIGGEWTYVPSLKIRVSGGEIELADALLIRNGIVVLFEHKAIRLDTRFLLGGSGDKILGPPDNILVQLEKEELTPRDTKRTNKGLVTRVMNQQTLNAQHIKNYVEDNYDIELDMIFVVNSHLADIHIGGPVYRDYLEPLIQRNNFYPEEYWQAPQWIGIEELELLANLADEGRLDLISVLEDKNSDVNKYLSFNQYLSNIEISRDRRFGRLVQEAGRDARRLLFPSSST